MADRKLRRIGTIKGAGLGLTFAVICAWLYFDFAAVSLISVAVIPVFLYEEIKGVQEKYAYEMSCGFREALRIMKNCLDAGYSVEKSMEDVVKGLGTLFGDSAAITVEFKIVRSHLFVGCTLESGFREMAERTKIKDIEEFACVFPILKRTGGDINKVIRSAVNRLNEKLALKRDMRMAVSAKMTEFNIMMAIPLLTLLYFKVCAPDMLESLYNNLFGFALMGTLMISQGGCCLWGRNIIRKTIYL